jgi:hypothetical protein
VYDPWNTCLRVVPGSFKYFGAAQRQGIINGAQSLELSLALIKCCCLLRGRYRGHFSYFFDQRQVSSFLNCLQDEDQLLLLEASEGACADVLYEWVPWPVRPEHHLVARTLRSISFASAFSSDPFSATADAIEIASWGPWIGFSPWDVISILLKLQAAPVSEVDDSPPLSVSGRRMMIPFFSNGFQGIVVGFFIGIDDTTAELIRTELLQYGQTLADKWSMIRRQHFHESLNRSFNLERMAENLTQMVSPVDYLVVRGGDQLHGYKLRHEGGYWAGYERLDREVAARLLDLEADIHLERWQISNAEVIIKTLSGHTMFDPVFTRARLELLLNHQVTGLPFERNEGYLVLETLRELETNLRHKAITGHPSHATLRQLCVVQKVVRHYQDEQVSITNSELKSFFSKYLKNNRSKNGYQISSHLNDLKKIFDNSVTISKTRNNITLKWISIPKSEVSRSLLRTPHT